MPSSVTLHRYIDRRLANVNRAQKEASCDRPIRRINGLIAPFELGDGQPGEKVLSCVWESLVEARDRYRTDALPHLDSIAVTAPFVTEGEALIASVEKLLTSGDYFDERGICDAQADLAKYNAILSKAHSNLAKSIKALNRLKISFLTPKTGERHLTSKTGEKIIEPILTDFTEIVKARWKVERSARIWSDERREEAHVLCSAFESDFNAHTGSQDFSEDRNRADYASVRPWQIRPALLMRYSNNKSETLNYDYGFDAAYTSPIGDIIKWIQYDWSGVAPEAQMATKEKRYPDSTLFAAWIPRPPSTAGWWSGTSDPLPLRYGRKDMLDFFTNHILDSDYKYTWFKDSEKKWDDHGPIKVRGSNLDMDLDIGPTEDPAGLTRQKLDNILKPVMKFRQMILGLCESWGKEEAYQNYQMPLLSRVCRELEGVGSIRSWIIADIERMLPLLSSIHSMLVSMSAQCEDLLELLGLTGSIELSKELCASMRESRSPLLDLIGKYTKLETADPYPSINLTANKAVDIAMCGFSSWQTEFKVCTRLTKEDYYRPRWDKPLSNHSGQIAFPQAFQKKPVLLVGLSTIDTGNSKNLDVSVSADQPNLPDWPDTNGFHLTLDFRNSDAYDLGATWLAIPQDGDIQSGRESVVQADLGTSRPEGEFQKTVAVRFERAYSDMPKVSCWLTGLASNREYNPRVEVRTANITTSGFDLIVRTWEDTQLTRVDVAWMACTGSRTDVQTYTTSTGPFDDGPEWMRVDFQRMFRDTPNIFHALSCLDSNASAYTRVRSRVMTADVASMNLRTETWSDSRIYHARHAVVVFGEPVK